MIGNILAKVIGTQNEREVKRLRPSVAEINALEPTIQSLTDEGIQALQLAFVLRADDLGEQFLDHLESGSKRGYPMILSGNRGLW